MLHDLDLVALFGFDTWERHLQFIYKVRGHAHSASFSYAYFVSRLSHRLVASGRLRNRGRVARLRGFLRLVSTIELFSREN